MPETNKENIKGFKKVPVGLVVLFTFLSLGIYIGYWFLSRKKTIKEFKRSHVIPFKWWLFFTVILVFSFLNRFIGSIILSPYGIAIFDSIDIIVSFYFLGLLYYSVFRIKEIVEEAYEEEIFSSWLLVLFHVWYIQYKLNRLGDIDHEEKSFTPQFAK